MYWYVLSLGRSICHQICLLIRLPLLELVNAKAIASHILQVHIPSIISFWRLLTNALATKLLNFLLRLLFNQQMWLVKEKVRLRRETKDLKRNEHPQYSQRNDKP